MPGAIGARCSQSGELQRTDVQLGFYCEAEAKYDVHLVV